MGEPGLNLVVIRACAIESLCSEVMKEKKETWSMNFLFSSYSFKVNSSMVFLKELLSSDQKPQSVTVLTEADLVAL